MFRMALRALVAACAAAGAAAQVSDDLDARFQRLQVWLQAGIDAAGIGSDDVSPLDQAVQLADGRFGRSLHAKKAFEEGETIFVVPISHIVRAKDYTVGLDGLPKHLACTVFIARERAAGEESRWKPYVDMLPSSHDLPRYWDQDLVQDNMEGSFFGDYIELQYTQMKTDFNQAWQATGGKTGGISWDDFKWGHDTYHTRSIFWNKQWVGEESDQKSSVLFPFFDLLMHGLPENADYRFDEELQAIRVVAQRPIQRGDEIMITYFYLNTRSNAEILNKWGFAVDEGGKKFAELTLPKGRVDLEGNPGPGADQPDDQEHMEVPTYALEQDAREGAARAFLAHLRARASPGSMYMEGLPEGWWAVPDIRNGWIFFWQAEKNEVLWSKPKADGTPDPDGMKKGPTLTPPTTWGVEVKILEVVKRMCLEKLALFPHTLQHDLDLLSGDMSDHRVRFMTMVRRDEKATLHWWLHLVGDALAKAPRDPDAQVDHGQLYLDPAPSWYTPRSERSEL